MAKVEATLAPTRGPEGAPVHVVAKLLGVPLDRLKVNIRNPNSGDSGGGGSGRRRMKTAPTAVHRWTVEEVSQWLAELGKGSGAWMAIA